MLQIFVSKTSDPDPNSDPVQFSASGLAKKLRIRPDPDPLHHLLLIFLPLPVADDRHQAEIGQLLILVERPVLPLQAVLRIRDVYPGSRILIFTHPGSRFPDPGSKNSNKREG